MVQHSFEESSSQIDKDVQTLFFGFQSSTSRPNSLRGIKFAALHHALLSLGNLASDHAFYLDPDVAKRASDYLGLISKNLDIDPPRFFPQDGEAAVFTWNIGEIKRLFTVDADELDLMYVNTRSSIRCDHLLPEGREEQIASILEELGARSSASSAMDGDV